MTHPPFRGYNIPLYTGELCLSLAFIPTVSALFYICVKQKNLHVNFRIMLFTTSLGYMAYDLARIILIIFLMSNSYTENLETAIIWKMSPYVHMTSNAFYTFSWLFLIVERAIASVFVDVYEKRFAGFIVPLLSIIAVSSITAAVIVIRFSGTAKHFDGYLVGLEIGIVLSSLAALIIIIIFNKSSYRKRHNSRMHLTNRYQLDENIRIGKYLMPVALNQVLVEIMSTSLSAYAIFFAEISPTEVGTFVYQAYCQIFLYQRLFFVMVLVLRSEKFNRFIKRGNRTAPIVVKQAAAASNYYNELKHMW
ncbi:hypothetical protein V3C99_010601 [Haemonchus contortus]